METSLALFAAILSCLPAVNGQINQSLGLTFDPEYSYFLPNTSEYYIEELQEQSLLTCVSRCMQQRPTCRGVLFNDVTGACKLLNVPPMFAYDDTAEFLPEWTSWEVNEQADVPGCFRRFDPAGGNILTTSRESNPNGRSYCREICISNEHTIYFGLKGTMNCLCGDQIDSSAFRVADSYCSLSCHGNSEETCGGATNEVYVDRV